MLIYFRVNGGATTIAPRGMCSSVAIIAQVCRQNSRQICFMAHDVRVPMVAAITNVSSPLTLENFRGILPCLWWVNLRLIQTDICEYKWVFTVIVMAIYIWSIQPNNQVAEGDVNYTLNANAVTIDVAQTPLLALQKLHRGGAGGATLAIRV